MRLTRQTDYAIRILMYCCSRGKVISVSRIASFYGLPEQFCSRLYKFSIKLGLLKACVVGMEGSGSQDQQRRSV